DISAFTRVFRRAMHVDRVPVLGERMRHEAVVARITHGGVQEAVDDQGAGGLVHLVFDRLTADRDLDDDVDVLGRVVADRDGVEAHGWALQNCGWSRRRQGATAIWHRLFACHRGATTAL